MEWLKKEGANKEKHENICKSILGEPYTKVHKFMDREKGPKHREEFGHDKKAEEDIKSNSYEYGEKCHDAFILHILTDRAYDKSKQEEKDFVIDDSVICKLKNEYEEIKNDIKQIPYYE